MAGGFDGERCLNNVDVFDPAVGQWSLVTSVMTSRRSGVATIAYQNILYCFGGFNGESRLSSGMFVGKQTTDYRLCLIDPDEDPSRVETCRPRLY